MQDRTEWHMQSQYHMYLGYSAKALNRNTRFLKVAELIAAVSNTTSKINWIQVVSKCGYYDQSQLIHDFKHYLNLALAQYAKQQHTICSAR